MVRNKFQHTNKTEITISLTITSSLEFLYIFGGSGLLCGVRRAIRCAAGRAAQELR